MLLKKSLISRLKRILRENHDLRSENKLLLKALQNIVDDVDYINAQVDDIADKVRCL